MTTATTKTPTKKRAAVVLNRNDRKFKDPSVFTAAETKIWILHEEGYSNKEIAASLGMTVSNVGMKLTVCREKIAAQQE